MSQEFKNFELDIKRIIQLYGKRRANYNLALSYQYGPNMEEVIQFYILAARYGSKNAQFQLGVFYQESLNWKEAVRYYLLGVQLGDSRAQANLGFCYQEGKGIERNLNEASRLYELACSQGNKRAERFMHALPSAKAVCERESLLFADNSRIDLRILKENCDSYTFALELIEIFINDDYPHKMLRIREAIHENNHLELFNCVSSIFDCSKTFGILIMDKKTTKLRGIAKKLSNKTVQEKQQELLRYRGLITLLLEAINFYLPKVLCAIIVEYYEYGDERSFLFTEIEMEFEELKMKWLPIIKELAKLEPITHEDDGEEDQAAAVAAAIDGGGGTDTEGEEGEEEGEEG